MILRLAAVIVAALIALLPCTQPASAAYYGWMQTFEGNATNTDYAVVDAVQCYMWIYPRISPYSVTGAKVNSLYNRTAVPSGYSYPAFVEIGYAYDSSDPAFSITTPRVFVVYQNLQGYQFPYPRNWISSSEVSTWRSFMSRRISSSSYDWEFYYDEQLTLTLYNTGIRSSYALTGMERRLSTDNGNASFKYLSARNWPSGVGWIGHT
jgi:hypothetical protein